LNASIENKNPQTRFQSKLEDEIRYEGKNLRSRETCRKDEKITSGKPAESLHKGSTLVLGIILDP
jgi:hypothetical protein